MSRYREQEKAFVALAHAHGWERHGEAQAAFRAGCERESDRADRLAKALRSVVSDLGIVQDLFVESMAGGQARAFREADGRANAKLLAAEGVIDSAKDHAASAAAKWG